MLKVVWGRCSRKYSSNISNLEIRPQGNPCSNENVTAVDAYLEITNQRKTTLDKKHLPHQRDLTIILLLKYRRSIVRWTNGGILAKAVATSQHVTPHPVALRLQRSAESGKQ